MPTIVFLHKDHFAVADGFEEFLQQKKVRVDSHYLKFVRDLSRIDSYEPKRKKQQILLAAENNELVSQKFITILGQFLQDLSSSIHGDPLALNRKLLITKALANEIFEFVSASNDCKVGMGDPTKR